MSDLFGQHKPKTPFELPDGGGYHATWDEKWRGFNVKIPDGEFFYSESFFNKKWSDRAVEYFLENDNFNWRTANWREIPQDVFSAVKFRHIAWRQDFIKLYGKSIPLPRLTSWYGDPGKSYEYSGIKSEPNPWVEGLVHIKRRIEECSESEFNCVLLNWYRDGQDSLNWHSDNEKELRHNPIIASANFGATRDFLIRKDDDVSQKLSLPLRHGTLLIMKGSMQHHWKHSIPKRARINENRFNLTFRSIN